MPILVILFAIGKLLALIGILCVIIYLMKLVCSALLSVNRDSRQESASAPENARSDAAANESAADSANSPEPPQGKNTRNIVIVVGLVFLFLLLTPFFPLIAAGFISTFTGFP